MLTRGASPLAHRDYHQATANFPRQSGMNSLLETFGSVALQMMSGAQVVLGDQKIPVKRVGRGRLRMVEFLFEGRRFEAIEQNPEKPSHWGKLARDKHQVVQFRDLDQHKYIAVSIDGKAREYASLGNE